MNATKFQEEHKAWVSQQYPDQPQIVPAAGMVEEAGELLHTALKTYQREIWGVESRYPEAALRASMVDAVGDCAIYACSMCNASGWPFSRMLSGTPKGEGGPLMRAVKLVQLAANCCQAPHLPEDVYVFVAHLRGFALEVGITFEDAVDRTWSEVKSRRRA